MGRDNHLLEVPQRRLLGERFGLEDVEARTGDRTSVERVDQRRLVDNWPASDVDEICIVAHRRQFVGTHHPFRRGGVRDGDRDEAGVGDGIVEVVRMVHL